MAPADAVARLVEFVAPRSEFTEDEVYDAMSRAGVPDRVADLALKFTQTAWGRFYLDGAGVRFEAEYICFDGAGDVIASGPLVGQPYYVAAVYHPLRHAGSPGYMRLVSMSADVASVTSAVQAGSKPQDLVMGPAAYFLEPATPAGLAKAQQLLARREAKRLGAGGRQAHRKPWWKVW